VNNRLKRHGIDSHHTSKVVFEMQQNEEYETNSDGEPTPTTLLEVRKRVEDIEHKETLFAELSPMMNMYSVVRDFVKKHPVYYDSSKIWWVWSWKKFCWQMQDETDVLNALDQATSSPTVGQKIKSELLDAFKRIGRLQKPKDAEPTWVQFKDKVIDMCDGREFKATPEFFIRNPIDRKIDLTSDDKTPVIDQLLTEWVGVDYVDTMKEILAYCLLPDYPIQRLFCFVGPGSNGKSCFLQLLIKFLGVENVTTTDLDLLMGNRFGASVLHGRLVCLMGETNFNEMKKTAMLKHLVGGDLISFEFKNKNPFQAKNYAKLVISTNTLPTTLDKTEGFYRRWLIVDFPNKFSEEKDVMASVPETEFNSLAVQLVAVLNGLLKKRAFTNEGDIQTRRKKFEEKSNPIEKFIKDNCDEDPNSHIFKFEFRKEVRGWMKDSGYRVWSDREIGIYMKGEFEDSKRAKQFFENGKLSDTNYIWAWLGLKWRENVA